MRTESIAPSMAMDLKKPCDISNLMSPPEPAPLDNFRRVDMSTVSHKPTRVERLPVLHPPLSPPVSPLSTATNVTNPVLPATIPIRDPILYPSADSAVSQPTNLLFIPNPQSPANIKAETERLVDEHIASRPAGLFREATPPRREDYELALHFQSNCLRMFTENPKAYFKKERELLRNDRKYVAMPPARARLPPILPASRLAIPKSAAARTTAGRVQKPKPAKFLVEHVENHRRIRATPPTNQQARRISPTPEPRVRTVAPNREDKDFGSLKDYCPPLSSLPTRPNSLKVDWKGNPLDLSKDPHRHLLHPDELSLAAGLRLDCATYLTSKRRIFERRLYCAKIRKEFRKTDAQQACKIDVNKASKLWTAFDKVGWLDIKWVQQYL